MVNIRPFNDSGQVLTIPEELHRWARNQAMARGESLAQYMTELLEKERRGEVPAPVATNARPAMRRAFPR